MWLYTPVNTTCGFITHWGSKTTLLFVLQQLGASPCLTTKHQGKDVKKLHTKPARTSKWYNTSKVESPQGIKLKVRKQARKSYGPWKVSGWRTGWRNGETEWGGVGEREGRGEGGGLMKIPGYAMITKAAFCKHFDVVIPLFQPPIY